MLIDYNPIVVSVIIRVSPNVLNDVKAAMVDATLKLETDDRSYLYVPGDYKVLLRRGHFIAKISNYVPPTTLVLETALKQTINILTNEDQDTEKFIFVIIDKYNQPQEEYGFTKAFNLNAKENLSANFIICDLGDNPALKSLSDPKCQYLKIENISDLGKQMIDIYYPEEERTVIDKEFKDKYGKTPYEARQELKEKYQEETEE